jgi:hypothetical protein
MNGGRRRSTTDSFDPARPLVTRFGICDRWINARFLYTGLTRDGTYLIENGKITKPVKNLRFNDSPIFMLNNLEAMGVLSASARARAAIPARRSWFHHSRFAISISPA